MEEQAIPQIEYPIHFPLKVIGVDEDDFETFVIEIVRSTCLIYWKKILSATSQIKANIVLSRWNSSQAAASRWMRFTPSLAPIPGC